MEPLPKELLDLEQQLRLFVPQSPQNPRVMPGVFSMVLECIESSLAKEVTKSINIPTIGIGASVNCDGQVLVTDDLLGLNSINVRFIKKYINLKKIINKATISFKNDVKNKKFPKMKHSY